MEDDELWQPLLREALAVLTLPPEQQALVNRPGCLACDLLNSFEHARLGAVGNAEVLSVEQRRLLDAIDAVMRAMGPPNSECFNDEVVLRPVWQRLRELAAGTLRAFGWESAKVEPFVEVKPGVWQRPPGGT